MSEEHDFEPVKGLPADLPQDERILWQGSADWFLMARQVFKVTWIAGYFVALMIWRFASSLNAGEGLQAAMANALWALPLAACALALFVGLAVINARTTVYTITNKRVVMRFGAALTKAINIPFKIIESASFNPGKGQSGDLAITLLKPNKIPLLLLWPHARPGKIVHPQPTLRCLKDGAVAAPILAEALRKAHDQAVAVSSVSVESQTNNSMGTPALA